MATERPRYNNINANPYSYNCSGGRTAPKLWKFSAEGISTESDTSYTDSSRAPEAGGERIAIAAAAHGVRSENSFIAELPYVVNPAAIKIQEVK